LARTTASSALRDKASQADTLSVSRWPAARADVTRRSPFVANLGVRRRDRPPVAGDRSRRSHRRQSFSAARQARHTSRQRTRESTGTRDRTSKSRAGGSAASVSGGGSAAANARMLARKPMPAPRNARRREESARQVLTRLDTHSLAR
jgi:hypothetical protein